MSLTKAQRRKQNRINAAHSTGPVTIAGKAASRANSLTHGFTATVLALPNENQAEIQARADAWHDACQPADHDQEVLVDRLALATLQMERLARAEHEIVAEQVRWAEIAWDKARTIRLQYALRNFELDPVRTIAELHSFGAGVDWMLARWQDLDSYFCEFGCWDQLTLINLALRLCDSKARNYPQESLKELVFAVKVLRCVTDTKEATHLAQELGFKLGADWRDEITVEEAVAAVQKRIQAEVAGLRQRAEALQAIEQASRAGASTRAWAPADTASNRLLLRYTKSAETSFDKSLRALQKLQSDRQKGVELEAKREAEAAREVGSPNEADQVGRTSSKRLHVGSYVSINRTRYKVVDTGDGNIVLECPEAEVAAPDLGVSPAPETAA